MIKDIKIISHETEDVKTHEKIYTDYVEFTTVGKTREWVNWMPVEEFKDKNPGML